MLTLILFIVSAVLIGFFGGATWLATAVTGIIFAMMFPLLTIFLVVIAIGLLAYRYNIK
jgi:hypothetical protein